MSCCVPGAADSSRDPSVESPQPVVPFEFAEPRQGLIGLAAGEFLMGDDGPLSYPEDGETPVRRVSVATFEIDPHCVTTAEFAEFVAATGFQTDAERLGFSFVFAGLLPEDFQPTQGVASAPWWRRVEGASWRTPEGPGSNADDRADHPVVHVSWHDAHAFAAWHGCRLPTEAEWEFAARAGSTTTFPWGSELEPGGRHMANVWQGIFPTHNTLDDGFYGTCPVDAFAANDFGLHNMIGNVWEWTASTFRDDEPQALTLKGGSFLCHASYCHRYRPAARSASAPDSSASNVGFRLAR